MHNSSSAGNVLVLYSGNFKLYEFKNICYINSLLYGYKIFFQPGRVVTIVPSQDPEVSKTFSFASS